MAQCLHLEPNGRQCGSETEAGRPFCFRHNPLGYAESALRMERHRPVRRLAAFLLLLIFLLPLAMEGYRVLRAWLN